MSRATGLDIDLDMDLDKGIDELLKRGVADWIDALEVADVVRTVYGATTHEESTAIAMQLVRAAIERGLVMIGDVRQDGFRESTAPLEEGLESLERKWRGLDHRQVFGELFWLANTPAGDERGNRLLSS